DPRGSSSKSLNLLHAPADRKPPRGPVELRDTTAVKANRSKRSGTNIRQQEFHFSTEQRPIKKRSIKPGVRERCIRNHCFVETRELQRRLIKLAADNLALTELGIWKQ